MKLLAGYVFDLFMIFNLNADSHLNLLLESEILRSPSKRQGQSPTPPSRLVPPRLFRNRPGESRADGLRQGRH